MLFVVVVVVAVIVDVVVVVVVVVIVVVVAVGVVVVGVRVWTQRKEANQTADEKVCGDKIRLPVLSLPRKVEIVTR